MSNGQYPPPPPGAAAPKQGLPGWAKILIGCGCGAILIILAVLAFMAWGAKKAYDVASDPSKLAELVISANPDLELVKNDKEAGTITVRNIKTGETTTVNYADIKEGKLTFEGKDGKYSVDGGELKDGGNLDITGPDGQKIKVGAGADLPAWVPLYPSAQGTPANYSAEVGDTRSGVASQTTTDDLATVKKYYEDYFAREGYTIKNSSSGTTGNSQNALLSAEKGNIDVGLLIASSGNDTSLTITYKGPK